VGEEHSQERLCHKEEKEFNTERARRRGKHRDHGEEERRLATGAEGKKSRVLSGMRPTGRLHIGHYFGALQNWVRLQNDPAYECFYFIADWHALTSDYADPSAVAENTLQIMIDYLAAGLDPQKSVIFQQSVIPEHAELHLLLSMVTPLGWLERVPTYKEALENVKDKDLHNYGFLGYPVLQTADIVIYSKEGAPLVVPVGEDQVSHVEISREIVRRFNLFYGFELDEALRSKSAAGLCGNFCLALGIPGNTLSMLDFPLGTEKWAEFSSRVRARILEIGIDNAIEHLKAGAVADMVKFAPVLQEPEVKLTLTPRIPGTDGRKMSKSYGNAITLSESDADIRAKTKVMVTDPARKRRTDPGNPDVCPVYDWHKLFSTRETLKWAAEGCRTAGIGCIECKAKMADHLIEWIAPVRERRVEYEKHPGRVLEILDEGSKKARKVAKGTMERVREAVFGWGKKRKEIGGTAAEA
jgi:tryptophanyl-tRNA synthetase